jgi:hypothetical protein
VSETKWIPTSERLPENGQEVLVFWLLDAMPKPYEMTEIRQFAGGLFWDTDDDGEKCSFRSEVITHWMPLPAPPESVQPGETPPKWEMQALCRRTSRALCVWPRRVVPQESRRCVPVRTAARSRRRSPTSPRAAA